MLTVTTYYEQSNQELIGGPWIDFFGQLESYLFSAYWLAFSFFLFPDLAVRSFQALITAPRSQGTPVLPLRWTTRSFQAFDPAPRVPTDSRVAGFVALDYPSAHALFLCGCYLAQLPSSDSDLMALGSSRVGFVAVDCRFALRLECHPC